MIKEFFSSDWEKPKSIAHLVSYTFSFLSYALAVVKSVVTLFFCLDKLWHTLLISTQNAAKLSPFLAWCRLHDSLFAAFK